MKSFALPADQTWRKLGYLLYGSSTSYRSVLEDNPMWSVDEMPPIGTVLSFSGSGSGQERRGIPQTLGQRGRGDYREIFPFSSPEEYEKASARYSGVALMSVEEANGWTTDSIQALTGLQ